MKKITTLVLGICGISQLMAQGPVVTDTVYTGLDYVNNKWYSLANDEAGQSVNNNWDIAFATATSPTAELTASILFNYKVGSVYAIPNSTPSLSFDTLATVNFSVLTALQNNDSSWAQGAINRAPVLGMYDYGFGTYNSTSHSVEANRIFVVKYTDNSVKKFYINLISMQGKYEIISADLGNGTVATTQDIVLSGYSTKNYVYYKINTNTIVDREPATTAWDFQFLQYPASISPGMQYSSFGILNNVGIEAVKVTGVTDVPNFQDHQSQTFSDYTNAIGYNWKNAQAQTVPSDVVYFVKVANGDIWKLVFTEFATGSSMVSPTANNKNVFTKQNLSVAGVDELSFIVADVYPNPASSAVNVVADLKETTTISIINQMGQVLSTTEVAGTGLVATTLSLDGIENGVYYVRLTSQTQSTVKSLQVIK